MLRSGYVLLSSLDVSGVHITSTALPYHHRGSTIEQSPGDRTGLWIMMSSLHLVRASFQYNWKLVVRPGSVFQSSTVVNGSVVGRGKSFCPLQSAPDWVGPSALKARN
ncbi:hypothetical protein AVEN_117267-1 [Araneus ventricosus]|uniref:Uncharacterized protein n=1 Tax=Araneus ventricosus TaxID=182803 RepID=A0A4Y2AZN1_ARAVE|nr:hypothetical protein AVEN_117267-1 [Araneus ventricosus]